MLKDDILALSKKSRSRRNLELIQGQIEELRGFADDAEEAISIAASLREALEAIGEVDGDSNPLLPWVSDIQEKAGELVILLPEDLSFDELVSEAEGYAEEYESCLEDSDMSADDREEVWGNLLDALINIADVL